MLPSLFRSFGFRIALFSTVTASAVLILFSVWTWSLIRRSSLDRLDAELILLGQRHLNQPRDVAYWRQVGESMNVVFGGDASQAMILLAKGPDGNILHQSPNWPQEILPDRFPNPLGPPPDWNHRPRRGPGFGPRDGEGPPRGDREFERGGPGGDRPPPRRAPGNDAPPPDFEQRGLRPEDRRGPGGPRPDGEGFPPPPPPDRGDFRGAPEGPPQAVAPGFIEGDETREGPRFDSGAFPGRAGGRGFDAASAVAPTFEELTTREGRWRIALMGNPHTILVLGMNLSVYARDLSLLRNSIALAILVALSVIAAAGWLSARQAIRPVKALTRAMEGVTATGLDTRIRRSQSATEFERMIDVFNGMLDRLSKSFHQATRFSADAAHELKTPLTILQGHLEQAVNDAPTGSADQRRLSALLEEVQRLKSIIRKLLILSRADTGELLLNQKPVCLSERVESACEDARILAPAMNVETRIDPELWALADEELLQQALQNLLNNALKYNNRHQRLRLSLRAKDQQIRLRISNTSDGIPEDAADHVFDRFFRVDQARNRAVDGQGLGLSLVKEIVEAHGGQVLLSHNEGGWVAFDLVLPALHAASGRG